MIIKQSIEPIIADIVNGWLKDYKLDYFLEQGSINSEIDEALLRSPSKTGGTGRNRVDAKLILQDSKLDYFPVMIEYKGYKNKLEKLDSDGHIENFTKKDEPHYKNIQEYAVNGAVHYANAVLQHTSFTEVIAIGVTGYKDAEAKVHTAIGVYLVSKKNRGVAKKIGEFTDLSFLKKDNFNDFIALTEKISLSEKELEAERRKDENRIENALTKINERIYNKEQNLSALSRIHLVAASIMANLGVTNKVHL